MPPFYFKYNDIVIFTKFVFCYMCDSRYTEKMPLEKRSLIHSSEGENDIIACVINTGARFEKLVFV